MLKNIQKQIITALFLTVSSGAIIIGFEPKPTFAACNPFGCSQSSAAECNPFGCPNAPLGKACTPFGCPESPQPPPVQQQPYSPYPYPPNPYPAYPYPPNSERVIKSIESAGSYWVYQKPSLVIKNPYPPNSAPYHPNSAPYYPAPPTYGGDPQAIQKCMKGLLYRTEERSDGWFFTKTIRVRTEISEDAAVRACQGAR